MGDITSKFMARQAQYQREGDEIEHKAMHALQSIVDTINRNPGCGQTSVLVSFLAAVYNSQNNRFELDDLRRLDWDLAKACLLYLDYDRLGRQEVHHHLEGGARWLHRQMVIAGQLDEAQFTEWHGASAC